MLNAMRFLCIALRRVGRSLPWAKWRISSSSAGLALAITISANAWAQTDPAPQALPYTQDFRTLPYASTTYPAGWQGWTNGTVGSAYLTGGPTGDLALVASSTSGTTTGGVHNYNGKIGLLNTGSSDFGLALAVNTTGFSGIVVRYEVATIRNPYDGSTNTRINEISLQYRVGNSGAWTTLSGTAYQNDMTPNAPGVTKPMNIAYRKASLPAACDNQATVQLRWAQIQVSGAGSRPSFAIDNVAVQQQPAGGMATALQFDGVDDYVTFGQAPGLNAQTFTIETWFRRTGSGIATATGSNGIGAAIPLVTKGLGEVDGSASDMNFFLGINTAGNVIAADYEEGAGQTSPGLNHPVSGTTPIVTGTWYHAAATFDGTTLRVYLNGVPEGTLVVGAARLPQSGSVQHAALATALNSTGGVGVQNLGFFQGALDEARIWNVARSHCDIVNSMNTELTSGAGLVARWGMHDGSGVVVSNSLTAPDGILMNGPTWATGSPFNAPAPPVPGDPTALLATAPDGVQVQLSWIDNATGEFAYEVERSTSGSGGPFSPLATLAANATAYVDAPIDAGSEYCYRVRALSACANSGYSTPSCATPVAGCNALRFDSNGPGTKAYVSFGNPATLKLSALTIEMWMRRDGPGVPTSTGGGGVNLIPLVSKGRADAETPTADINYILGIRASDGVLAADFEEGPTGASPSMNHPVTGTTTIPTGVWQHVAATYDGTTWMLYLNGQAQATLSVGEPLGSASNVSVALASALTLAGSPAGYFDGALDEVRIWNYARTLTQIQQTINSQISSPTAGLVGRWALDEGAGTVAYGTAGTGINGSIVGSAGTNWDRTECAPFSWTLPGVEVPLSGGPLPHEFALGTLWPNPSRGSVNIEYSVPRLAPVRLVVTDLQGREVQVLVDDVRAPGRYHLSWSGRTSHGLLPAGVYFLRYSTPDRSFVRRVALRG